MYPSDQHKKIKDNFPAVVAQVFLGIAITLCAIPTIFTLYVFPLSISSLFYLWIPMPFNTAVGILIFGLIIFLLTFDYLKSAQFLSIAIVMLGFLTLFQYIFKIDLGIDQIFSHFQGSFAARYPGRMCHSVAACFILIGLAFSLISRINPSGRILTSSGILGAPPAAIGLLTLLGHERGQFTLTDPAGFAHIAFPTSIALLLLGIFVILKSVFSLRTDPKDSVRTIPTCVTILLLGGFVALWQFELEREDRFQRQSVKNEAEKIGLELEDTLRDIMLALQRFAIRIEYLGLHDKAYLTLDSRSYLDNFPLLKRIGITDSQYKVIWSYPSEIRQEVAGFDQSKDPLRFATLNASRENQRPSLSPAIELRSGGTGFLLPIPMYRHEKLFGFIYGTVQANSLFQNAMRLSECQLAVHENGVLIFSSHQPDLVLNQFKYKSELQWGLARWDIEVTPTEKFVSRTRSSLPHFILVVGCFISLLIGAFFNLIFLSRRDAIKIKEQLQKNRDELEIRVSERTKELQSLVEALSEAKKIIDTVTSNTSAILFSINKEGIITYVDGNGLSNLGVTRDQRLGHSIYEINKDRPESLQILQKALDGQKVKNRIKINSSWYEMHCDPIFDLNGSPNGLIGISLNVDEQVRSELALTETQRRLTEILKQVPFAFWAVDGNRRFIFREGIGMTAVGMTSNEMVGKSIDDIYKDFPHVIDGMNRAFAGETFEMQVEIGYKWYNVAFAPSFTKDAKVNGISGITFDITDRKKMQDEKANLEVRERSALEASRLKSEFLANMSHEIRTPLNGVIGMADLLMDTLLSKDQKTYATIIQQSGSSLLGLINDILDFSKIEADKLELEKVSFSLILIVEGQADVLVAKARKKGLSLVTYISNDLPANLIGDPGRIGQILLNLTGNAIKFSAQGGVSVRVIRGKIPVANNNSISVRFEVEDTGVGLTSQVRTKLFQPFVQGDESTARKFGGTGLGLSICKRLVENMNGTIGVDSDDGKGSTFWFEIPLEIPTEQEKLELKNNQRLSHLRVLIVDDDQITLNITQLYIISWGINHTDVALFSTLIQTLKQQANRGTPYHLVILGYGMNSNQGFKLGSEIQTTFGETAPKVILMTEFEKPIDENVARKAGFTNVLSKPIKQSALFDSISRFINGSPNNIQEKINQTETETSLNVNGRILVADDVAANQILSVKLLENLGYSAHSVANGKEVLEALTRMHYDLVLMDCQMPEMDGFEATQSIRNSSDQTIQKIPIIALTANAMAGDDKKCIAAGMNDYLSKPIKKEPLREKLEKWLRPKN